MSSKPVHCVIGTAGHIDHGKTRLVEALTGTDCDRFEEEKKRGITIDLGFARMELSNGAPVGLVDVPGHQRFVHNMLAGAAGVDMALFVIAADDSVMPQTIEHLAILEMLGVDRGVVALTKADLVDGETLELATLEVAELIERSCLKGAAIIPCSAVTGQGIDELRKELERLAMTTSRRVSDAFFRMPIDRVFTVKGHGKVVTGTVFSGQARAEDRLAISPGGHSVRVRRIQSHGYTLNAAGAGTRAALNITSADKDTIERGAVICHPAISGAVELFTANIVCHATSPLNIVHGRSYLLHVHTAERLCRVYLSSEKSLKPGDSCVAQVRFDGPVNLLHADRFVIRSSSAQHTIGGGVILEPGGRPMGRRRMRSFNDKWNALQTPEDGARALVAERPWGVKTEELQGFFNLPAARFASLLKEIRDGVNVLEWKGAKYAYDVKAGASFIDKITDAVSEFHKANPTLPGMEESAIALGALAMMPPSLAGYWIRRAVSSGKLASGGSLFFIPGRTAVFTGEDEKLRGAILGAYKDAGLKNPPKTDKVYAQLNVKKGDAHKMIRVLTQSGDLVSLAPDYTLHKDALSEARAVLVKELEAAGSIETAKYRDLLGVGRKAAIDILEWFDRDGLTRRIDNKRVLRDSPTS